MKDSAGFQNKNLASKRSERRIEWIGEIPEEWKVTNVKRVCEITLGKMVTQHNIIGNNTLENYLCAANIKWNGINTEVSKQMYFSKSEKEQYLLKKGDVLVMEGGMAGTSAIYNGEFEPCYIQNSVLRCRSKVSNFVIKYLYYWLYLSYHSGYMDCVCNKATIQHFTKEKLSETPIVFPNHNIQLSITKYLDSKCAKIDSLKNNIEKQIETLEQYKKSIITEAVTKGINPNVKMKDSGIDNVTKIPETWEEKKIKFLFDLVTELNHLPMDKVQLLSLYTDLGVFPHGEQEERGNKAVTVEGYKKVKKNDLVVNIILAWMGAMGISKYDGVTSPAYDIYRPKSENVNPKFYHYLFRTPWFAGECDKHGRGIMKMRWRTYSQEFMNIKIPYPSAEEQKNIVEYLDSKCTTIDNIINSKKQQLEKLEEYKKSLIFEYVTGKKLVSFCGFSNENSGKREA